jgi:parvulin-like peptidyl-prolyl isomerase
LVKRSLIVALVAVLAFAGYWFFGRSSDIAAVVNGREIPRAELNARVDEASEQYAMYGIEVNSSLLSQIRQEILDELIDEALLIQGAAAAGITIDESEVDEYYLSMVESYESEEVFLVLLAEYGFTVESFRTRIREQMSVQRLADQFIEDNVDPADLAITEAEMKERYDYYTEMMDDPPPFEEVKEYIAEELRNERIQELYIIDTLIMQLRDGADIQIKIKL